MQKLAIPRSVRGHEWPSAFPAVSHHEDIDIPHGYEGYNSVVVGRLKKVLNQTGYLDILDIQPERHTNYQFTRYSIAGKLEIGNWYTIKIFKL